MTYWLTSQPCGMRTEGTASENSDEAVILQQIVCNTVKITWEYK